MAGSIGLIGLGNIGGHFGTRLLAAGYDLVVFDRDPEAMNRLVAKGAVAAKSAASLASTVETVLLCLPMPAIVLAVASEVAEGTKVTTVVDLSTTGPTVTKEMAALLDAKNISFVGAPVSGGTVAAEKGTLSIMPSGPEETFRKVEPVLKVIGKNIFYMGEDASLGQTMKIINNTLYATSMVASCEALVYGVKAGLDASMMLDVLNASSGRSFATLERIPQCVLDRGFPVRFTTELLHKDIKMCLDEAEKIGATMVVSPAARQFLAFAISQGDGQQDNVFPIRHFEQWAGVQFGKAPDKQAG
ncbi:MAG: NAD(P)-dependent oxidoreductase [Rhizobiaceae bacterium]|nr:NAD(P)-dependent oxidoreductase [Rhizobiaceae bacterium]